MIRGNGERKMGAANSFIKGLVCSKCKKTYREDEENHLCTCGAPLLVEYDLKQAAKKVTRETFAGRPASLWRYRELLPVKDEDNIVTLGEGFTPLLPLRKAGERLGLSNLYIKDEGVIPTGTFKARGAAVGISKAKELGVRTIAMPTNGNAGAAWSLYSARAGIRAVIVMPEGAPKITRNECLASGADIYLVKGLISDCGKIVGRSLEKNGWYDASTLKEPYRIEGKKTMGLEIAEQFGWEVPDVILYPTGGGVGIIGICKALRELREIGLIGEKLPRLVAVQAEGCAPIVKAFEAGAKESEFFPDSHTVAFGINVPKALGDFLVLDAIYETNGSAVSVSDEEILSGWRELVNTEGVYPCPEGAALYAAVKKLQKDDWIQPQEKVVMLNTGTGLKYPNVFSGEFPYLDLEAVL